MQRVINQQTLQRPYPGQVYGAIVPERLLPDPIPPDVTTESIPYNSGETNGTAELTPGFAPALSASVHQRSRNRLHTTVDADPEMPRGRHRHFEIGNQTGEWKPPDKKWSENGRRE